MPESMVRTFTDADLYHRAIRHAQTDGIVLGRGEFRVDWTTVRLDRLWLQGACENLPRVSYSQIDPALFGVIFPTFPGLPIRVHGIVVALGEAIVYRPGSEGNDRSSAACGWASVALRHEDLAGLSRALIDRELPAVSVTRKFTPPAQALSRLSRLYHAADRLAWTAPGMLTRTAVAQALENGIAEALVGCIAGADPGEPCRIDRRRQKLMARLEAALQANGDRPLYSAELCAAADVSYPTLRAFCQEQLGMSPKRYLLLRRMHLARRALQREDAEKTTVTRIATHYGFWELGRFAGVYRSLFGEPPLATLRRTPRDPRAGAEAVSPWEFADA
jgi:AraC-like DNA-binding protein